MAPIFEAQLAGFRLPWAERDQALRRAISRPRPRPPARCCMPSPRLISSVWGSLLNFWVSSL